MSPPLRVARAALKLKRNPPTSCISNIVVHRRQPTAAVSSRTMTSINHMAANSILSDTMMSHRRRGFGHDYSHYSWSSPYCNNWTIQMMSSSTTADVNLNDGANNAPIEEAEHNEQQEVDVDVDEEDDDVNDMVIPFRRSKKERKSVDPEGINVSSFDDRAQAKLTALSNAKKEAEDARAAFFATKTDGDDGDDADSAAMLGELHERWNASEQKLALAYSQAIKYTSRINKNEEATRTAERLLFEWMDRFVDTFDGVSLARNDDDNDDNRDVSSSSTDAKTALGSMNKKKMIKTMNQIIPILESSDSKRMETEAASLNLPKVRIPPPTSKDYTNLLRAYSLSKARRKGQKCEVLMRNMVKLAKGVAFYYNEDSSDGWKTIHIKANDVGMESTVKSGEEEGNMKTKKWRFWVKESIPNSKQFALAIKCHAGSTHNESLERIFLLNDIHNGFVKASNSQIPGMYEDDPYVLFHSIKALKNLQKGEEREKGEMWLRKLHKFVCNPENIEYIKDEVEKDDSGELESMAKENDQAEELNETTEITSAPSAGAAARANIDPRTIDVTSAYTTMIRLMAKLRGADGVAAEARKILNRMHRVHNIFVNGLSLAESDSQTVNGGNESNEATTLTDRKRIAYISIRSNAYNLVLGLYRDSKKSQDADHAIELLQRMIDASNEAPENRSGVPLPTEQSFEFTILSLANMADGVKAIQEAERLIQLMQDQDHIESSVASYNALITVCNKQLFGKDELFDKAMDILNKMNEMGKTNPNVLPNPETLAIVMKACSLSEHDDHGKVLGAASKIFSQLEEQETDEKTALALTDRAYFYMMKCVDSHMVDDESAKKERLEELFSEACQRGLCSANVLTMFRNSVSEEDYRLTVGKGRLANQWIANITGPRALYTDGSQGGAGKHARRKGKSTSDWKKKQKVKEAQLVKRKDEKRVKKFFKSGGKKGASPKKKIVT